MAIDTAAKRNSIFRRARGVVFPDGTISSEDRWTLLGQYGYVTATPPAPVDYSDILRATVYVGRSSGVEVNVSQSKRFTVRVV